MAMIDVTSLVATAIAQPVSQIKDIADDAAAHLSDRERRLTAIKIIDYLPTHIERHRFGRVRAGLILAFSLMPGNRDIWRHAVRRGVLSIGSVDDPSRAKLWKLLLLDGTESLVILHQALPRRIASLASLDKLRERLRSRFIWYRNTLRTRPLGMLKSAMAYADYEFITDGDIAEYTFQESDHSVMIESREELTECVSTLVAEALEQSRMHNAETSMPASLYLESPELARLMSIAALRLKLRYFCKHVDALDYEIHTEQTTTLSAHVLIAPSSEHELWHRYGYIERQLADIAAPLNVDAGQPLLRVRELFQEFIRRMLESGSMLLERVQTPYPRFRIHMPWEAVFKTFLNGIFYEDAHAHYMDDHELQLDPTVLEHVEIAPGLPITDFLTLFRALRYLALLHVEIIASNKDADSELVYNSLLPLLQRPELITALAYTNVAISRIEVFIDLVSVDTSNRSHLDLQYKPLIRHGEHYLILPRLAASSEALRNSFASARTRVPQSGNFFASNVSGLLSSIFQRIAVNRKIESSAGSTDLDVVTLAQRRLYIWECKHSLPPTSPHEARDIWNDIENALEQTELARRILASDRHLSQRLRSWFPGAREEELQVDEIVPIVMLSTRIWSGLHLGGVPVRDVHSLRRLLRRDGFGIPVPGREREHEFERFAMPGDGPISLAELDDYLRPNGNYWSLRRAWSRPFTLIHARFDDLVIAHHAVMMGPLDYDGLVPDAREHGYESRGIVTRVPKLLTLKTLYEHQR